MIHMRLKPSMMLSSLLLITSCYSSKETKIQEKSDMRQAPEKTQVLKVNIQSDLTSLNPHVGIDLNCRAMQNALFEGLTRRSQKGIENAAAEKIEISVSQTTYTFTLRDSVWSNGEKLKAKHFEQAWKGGLKPDSNCLRADLFYAIKNAERAKKNEIAIDEVGVKAIDDHTLVVELEHPTPYFLDLISLPLFAPSFETDSVEPTVFNGPFVVKSWEHEKRFVLKRNPHYWDRQNVLLDEIAFSLVHDSSTALLMYEKGELDWVGSPFTQLPLDALPALAQNNKIKTQLISGVYWFCCNTHTFPLNSIHIRKALAFALNRDELANYVACEKPSGSLIPLTMAFSKGKEPALESNMALAKQCFEEGLKELNIEKAAFPHLVLSHSDVPGQKALVEAVAQTWERVLGIHVELAGSEWNVFFNNLGTRQYQIGGCIWFSAFNDPIYTLAFFKNREHRYNAPGWENGRYKELLSLADYETDLEKRRVYLREAEGILLDEMPVIPLYVLNYKYMMNEHVQGVYISDLGLVDFKWARIES